MTDPLMSRASWRERPSGKVEQKHFEDPLPKGIKLHQHHEPTDVRELNTDIDDLRSYQGSNKEHRDIQEGKFEVSDPLTGPPIPGDHDEVEASLHTVFDELIAIRTRLRENYDQKEKLSNEYLLKMRDQLLKIEALTLNEVFTLGGGVRRLPAGELKFRQLVAQIRILFSDYGIEVGVARHEDFHKHVERKELTPDQLTGDQLAALLQPPGEEQATSDTAAGSPYGLQYPEKSAQRRKPY